MLVLVLCTQQASIVRAQSKPAATPATTPAVTPATPPTSQEAHRQAKVFFARAETQYRLGHFAKALANYQAALKFRHHPSIIFNIAQCYRHLKNAERAVFFYKLFLADWERMYPRSKAPNEAEVLGHVAKLEALVRTEARARKPTQRSGELLLQGVPPGAHVLVDGVLRGQGPISVPITVTPGKRLVRVERSGYESWAQILVVVAGRRVSASVHLRKFVNVGIDSQPNRAVIFVDGTERGWTPKQLTLLAERTYALELRKRGYVTVARSITLEPKEMSRISYTLEPTRQFFGSRNEWFAFESELAVAKAGFVGGGVALNIVTLKWQYASWTILSLGGGRGTGARFYSHLETRVGYPLRFGRRGQHQLRAGVGFGMAAISIDDETRSRQELAWIQRKSIDDDEGDTPFLFLCLSPSVEYLYQTFGRTFFGAGLRVLLPVTGDILGGLEGSPAILLFTARIGWASQL
ncbi:MAG: PEGA domain-containing protein [Deltaproteobacteria bacterium]|nr:PEGA domain-containing protein [Deltaproteobacteria bacterium]